MGRDATVSWGGPDLVFRNDLRHAILIKAHGDAYTFTVSFYGAPQGRRVVATTSAPSAYTSPTLQYAVDPSAPRGSVRTEPGGGPGFSVNVHRKVVQRGKVVREDDFFTRYTPQNATAIYGPGKTPPGPYFVLPPGA
jgi:vancomycin resistance protein YoaR